MNLAEGLVTLLMLAEKESIRINLEYDTGRYVSGEDIQNPGDEPPPEAVKQGPSGWRVEVDMREFTDPETGRGRLYSTLPEAIGVGLYMIKRALIES